MLYILACIKFVDKILVSHSVSFVRLRIRAKASSGRFTAVEYFKIQNYYNFHYIAALHKY